MRDDSHGGMFSLQGVQEHAFFFKSIANANALRQRVCECFERAALPQTSQQVCVHLHCPSLHSSCRSLPFTKGSAETQCIWHLHDFAGTLLFIK